MRICLVGPCDPSDLMTEMHLRDADIAKEVRGYRGIPVSELAKGLIAAGHEVSIATLAYQSISQSMSFSGQKLQMTVHQGRPRARQFLADNYRQERGLLAESIRGFEPDIVHAHWTYEFALGALDTGLPCAITAHDSPYTVARYFKDAYRSARLLIAQQVAFRTKNLSTVSPYLSDRWRTQMLYRRLIEMIPNSVPTDVRPVERRPAAHPVIISVGDSSALKNLPTLIKAFSRVRTSVPDAELRLIGPGLGTNDPMATSTRNSEIAAGLTFVGHLSRSELADEYGSAWLLVHPSLEEAFGLTLVEAMSAGVPVLGGIKSGSVPFVLNHGMAGWLCRVSDANELAKAMLDKIEVGRPAMPPTANEYVEANFSPEIVTAKYLDWYCRILEKS